MFLVRKSSERGVADFNWLKSFHSFSFADYFDPKHMGFRSLRVINDDYIKAGTGFPTHPHQNMEIITYVIEGSLKHEDSMGNKTIIRPNEVQRMTAGTGIFHSEYSNETKESTHLLQIWILPRQKGLTPSYGQRSFEEEFRRQNFNLVASPNGENSSVVINQDVKLFVGKFKSGETKSYELAKNRFGWIQMVKGQLKVNEIELNSGDGLSIENETDLNFVAFKECEFLFFDLN